MCVCVCVCMCVCAQKPLVSRLTGIIPFFPFTTHEASVVVASELRKLQASVKRPPQDEGQIGGLDMVIQVCVCVCVRARTCV